MTDRVSLSAQLPEITAELFTQATAIIGIRGSGKTNDGVLIAEQAIRHIVPVVVIDPTGVWWGLKSSADGKSAGLPVYVFGGAHADVPLDPNAGALLARFVVERRVPIILDLSDMSKGQQRRFVALFCETLYDLKARNREPLLVVLDEAARFVPQTLARGDIALSTCVGAVEDMVALGRSRGLGCVLIGQRPATINKNVLTQADTLIAMRTVGTQDRKALDEWITEAQGEQQQRDELVQNVASLQQGEGYFWSPAIFGVFRRVKFGARTTFDSSRTPKIGEKIKAPTAFAVVDLEALTAEIAATVEQAKADDPKALRATLAERDRQIAQMRNSANPAPVEVERIVEKPVLTADDLQLLRTVIGALGTWGTAIDLARRNFDDAKAALEGVYELTERVNAALEAPPLEPRSQAPRSHPTPVRAATSRSAEGSSEPGNPAQASLGGGHLKIMEALAMRHPEASTRNQVATLAGYAPSGGGFANYLGALRSRGLIDYPASGSVMLTAEGAKMVRSAIGRAPATAGELLALWMDRVGSASRVLEVVARAYPKALTKAQIADAVGMSAAGGGFANYLGKLRGLGLIEYVSTGVVRASDDLFPGGR